jgi:glycosyltransferase involved in cell wall biosynthesis
VLEQTFKDFEFVIVNDGSTDGTKEALEIFEEKDERIRLIHQKNTGVARALNRGLEVSRGRYIARMDADDITAPTRLQEQVDYLEAHPGIGIVGTQVDKIGPEGEIQGTWELPTDPEVIAWDLLFRPTFCHPTVMARRRLLVKLGGYAEWATHAEDYELWTRAVRETRLANLQQTLHYFRKWGGSITSVNLKAGIQTCCKAAVPLHETVLGEAVDEQVVCFLVWARFKSVDRAMEEVGIDDLVPVLEHLRCLYLGFVRRVLVNKSSIIVRRRAIDRCTQIAEKLSERKGWTKGIWYRFRARLLEPLNEVVPWLWAAAQDRLGR